MMGKSACGFSSDHEFSLWMLVMRPTEARFVLNIETFAVDVWSSAYCYRIH
jgi:hypothetical protein